MRRRPIVRAGRPFRIPGWSVGYNDEIGAHAATRSVPGEKNTLFVMTSDDREPRSLDEEVTVGLYFFDGEEWEQLAYADFPSVSAVLDLSAYELQLSVEHGLSINDARQMLVDEIADWVEGREDEEYEEPPEWGKMIFEDSGVKPGEYMETAAHEATEQVLNASHGQILDYMNARAEAIES